MTLRIIAVIVLAANAIWWLRFFLLTDPILTWHPWFAWYPIAVSGKRVWLKTIERRRSFSGTSSETCVDFFEYRMPGALPGQPMTHPAQNEA